MMMMMNLVLLSASVSSDSMALYINTTLLLVVVIITITKPNLLNEYPNQTTLQRYQSDLWPLQIRSRSKANVLLPDETL